MRTTHAPQGFIAMVTVLVMMAVLLAIGLTVASIGRDEIALAGIVQDGDQAFSVADGCAEEAIDRLKGDSAYAGGTYSLAGGACTVAVTNLGGIHRRHPGCGKFDGQRQSVEAMANGQHRRRLVRVPEGELGCDVVRPLGEQSHGRRVDSSPEV